MSGKKGRDEGKFADYAAKVTGMDEAFTTKTAQKKGGGSKTSRWSPQVWREQGRRDRGGKDGLVTIDN